MGGCQNHGPFVGTLNIRGRIISGIQKRTMILTTTHIRIMERKLVTTIWGVGDHSDKNRRCCWTAGTATNRANPSLLHQGLGFRVQGLGFRVQGLGFRV